MIYNQPISPLRQGFQLTTLLVVHLFIAFTSLTFPTADAGISVYGKGASLPQTVYQSVISLYSLEHDDVDVSYDAVGSSKGKASIVADTDGSVLFAGSDSLVSDEQYQAVPDLQMLPALATAVVPIYNLPGLESSTIVFSQATLAGIFKGDITQWDAPEIAADNPSVSLPNEAIVVVVRLDGSGTTGVFTEALSLFDPTFGQAGDTIDWHAGVVKASKNDGVVAQVLYTPYSISCKRLLV